MEIEAKFNVPNAKVLAHLNALEKLARFSVLPAKTKTCAIAISTRKTAAFLRTGTPCAADGRMTAIGLFR